LSRRQESISAKLGLAIGLSAAATTFLCVLAVGALLVGRSVTGAVETARSDAGAIASELSERLNRSAQITQELQGLASSAVRYHSLTRPRLIEIMRRILAREPEVHGIWLIAEPNGIDGRDAAFRGSFGSSASGELFPYWYRDAAGRLVQDTTGRRDNVAEDRASIFYRAPVAQKRIVVTEPFLWRLGEGAGEWKTMASVSGPVRVDGRLAGVVGVDLYLDDLVRELKQRAGGNRVRYALISDAGAVVLASDPALIRQRASSLPLSPDLLRRAEAAGHAGVTGAWAGEFVALVSLPISFEAAKQPWRLIVAAPLSAGFGSPLKLLGLAIAGGVLLTALAAVVGRRLGRGLASPVTDMAQAMRRMAQGDMDTPIPQTHGVVELDEMAQAMQAFRDYAARAASAEAARRRAEQLARERSAQLRITSANLPLQAFLDLIVEEVLQISAAEAVVVGLVEDGDIVYRAGSGQLQNADGMRIPTEGSISGICVRSREVQLCDDAHDDPRLDPRLVRRTGLRSTVIAPLCDGERVFGVLMIGSYSPGAFTPQHAADLAVFADVIAAAIAREMAREAAENANRAKSEFLANMSHEIRTPLNGIVGTAEVLARADLTARDRELVDIIRTSGETLASLLSDILDQARIEAGRLNIEIAPFHLGDLVRATAALWRLRADEQGVELTVHIAPELDRAFLGDALRVRQVLTNFVSNAVKFTAAGRIAIQAAPGPQGRVRILVEDTGVGFDAGQRGKIFGRFEQADGSITRRFGGTGLGLAISHQLTGLMGGEIDCDSSPGQGSRFWVDLPLEPAELGASASEGTAGAAPEPGLKVLIADDHPTNRKVVELMLDQLGASYVSTCDGAAALEAFRGGRFDVVLMDMQMPVMDGLSATRAIREHEARLRLARTPVVMLTANALREHVEASLAAGADHHLPKPITAAALVQTLAASLAPPEGELGRAAGA